MLLEQRNQLIVYVAHHVREDIDAAAQQVLGVFEIRCVHGDADLAAVGLVDDRAVEIRLGFSSCRRDRPPRS